jgi:hypothetical protein
MCPDTVARLCLAFYRARVPAVWGFAWLAETLVMLLRSELEADRRLIVIVDEPLAGDLLRATDCLVRNRERQYTVRRRLMSPDLIAWWARWETLEPALREMAVAMPVAWLLALWQEAADQSTPPAAVSSATPQTGGPS